MFGRIAMACAAAVLGLYLCSAAGAAAGGSAPQGGVTDSPCPGAGSMIDDEATRLQALSTMLCLVNRRRAAAGVAALRPSAPLGRAATAHSTAMVERHFFGHSGSDGLRRRAIASGYIRRDQKATLGETIGWGAGKMATPAQLMAAFMASPAHRRTLLYPRFRDAGVGITLGTPLFGVGGPSATVTVDFGRR